ncbi:MAG: CBASS cGAMP-activated phospholipase [Pseudomonadota bacterium]
MATMRILAIDGGGIRGYFSAYLLERIQDELAVDLTKTFDLICGTSTGAIIAASLAIRYPLKDVLKLYEDNGRHIFSKTRGSWFGLMRARYDIERLRTELDTAFGDRTLSETDTRLLIPATDIGNAQVHVFKSSYSVDFVRDRQVRIADAVLASCAAPTYFKPAYVDPYLLADGGLWANNPAMVGYIEAITRLGAQPGDVKVLSLGTGTSNQYFRVRDKNRLWGVATGWGIRGLVDLLPNLQSKNTHNMLGIMLPANNYVRLNFEREQKLSLDDIESLPELRSVADRVFAERSGAIRLLLGKEGHAQ